MSICDAVPTAAVGEAAPVHPASRVEMRNETGEARISTEARVSILPMVFLLPASYDVQEILSLNLHLIAGIMEGPCAHAIHEAFSSHPLHLGTITSRQLDTLRYGQVLDRDAGLFITCAPPTRRGSSADAFLGYEHTAPDDSLLCVFKCISGAAGLAKVFSGGGDATDVMPLFLLSFTSVTTHLLNDLSSSSSSSAPPSLRRRDFERYYLQSVCVSSQTYYEHYQKTSSALSQYQFVADQNAEYGGADNRPGSAAFGIRASGYGKVLSNHANALLALCDHWMLVLHGIIATDSDDAQELSSSSSSPLQSGVAFVSAHLAPAEHLKSTRTRRSSSRKAAVSADVCSHYRGQEERICGRVSVLSRSSQLLMSWRNGDLDLIVVDPLITAAAPTLAYSSVLEVMGRFNVNNMTTTHRCVRLLLRDSRRPFNECDGDDLCAYLPTDEECACLKSYATLAAERLHLWVLRGLIAAEIKGIHNVLLDLDPTLIISQCVGLLKGSISAQDKQVLFHVCKIVVETVEDFVQHSGIVWRVIIAVSDFNDCHTPVSQLCETILHIIQQSKLRVEVEGALRSVLRTRSVANGGAYEDGVDEVAAYSPKLSAVKMSAMVKEQMLANSGHSSSLSKPAVDATNAVGSNTPSALPAAACEEKKRKECEESVDLAHVEDELYANSTPPNPTYQLGRVQLAQSSTEGPFQRDADMYLIFNRLSKGKRRVSAEALVACLMQKGKKLVDFRCGPLMRNRFEATVLPSTTDLENWMLGNAVLATDACGIPWDENRVRHTVYSFCRTYCARTKSWWKDPSLPSPLTSASETYADSTLSLSYVEFSMFLLSLTKQ